MTAYSLDKWQAGGILSGFRNLFAKEMDDWWHSKRWWTVLVIFLVTINGLTLILTSMDQIVAAERTAAVESGISDDDLAALDAQIAAETPSQNEMAMMYFLFGGAVMIITGILLTQDTIVGERQLGTAQWIISKPVSRSSFILSKFSAHSLGLLIVGVLAQGIIAYSLLRWRAGISIALLDFVLASGLLWSAVLFFLALTLMLGIFSDSRALVAGVPIGLVLMFQYILSMVPILANYTPYALIFPIGNDLSIAGQIAVGQPVTSMMPFIATLGWIILFLGTALWRFSSEEF